MPKIALAIYHERPHFTEEETLLRPPLEALDIAFEVAVWNDPLVDWTEYDAVVIRSTWDYHTQVALFVEMGCLFGAGRGGGVESSTRLEME
ncbi:MAG UNVERIFIED_CONTAM: hypothetical protein LVT10_18855 [Anaerolineae bacterium]|jgi:hypothetical protein